MDGHEVQIPVNFRPLFISFTTTYDVELSLYLTAIIPSNMVSDLIECGIVSLRK